MENKKKKNYILTHWNIRNIELEFENKNMYSEWVLGYIIRPYVRHLFMFKLKTYY